MAAINLYLANALSDGWRQLNEATQAAATLADGWVVSTGATNHSEYEVGVERAASTFVGTTPPDGSLDTTLKDAFRSQNAYTGDFASANWEFHGVVRAVTNGGAQDGRVRFRLFKADANGANATEITAAQQQGALVSNVSTSADFDSTLTFNPGAFSISGQYLFFQIAWERTGAGGMASSDIAFRTGSSTTAGTRIVTSNFTPAAQTISAAGAIGGAGAFGTAKLNFALLNVGALASAEAFGTAKLNFTLLNAGAIGGAEAFGSPTLTITGGGLTISGAGAIGGAEAFGAAKLNFTIAGAGAIGTAEAFGGGKANFTILGAGNIASAEQFGAPTVLGGEVAVEPAVSSYRYGWMIPEAPQGTPFPPKKKKKLKELFEQPRTGSRQARRIAEDRARELIAQQAAERERKDRQQKQAIDALLRTHQ